MSFDLKDLLHSLWEGFKGVLWVVVSGAITTLMAKLPQVGDSFDIQVVVFYIVLFLLLALRDQLKKNTKFGAHL